LDADVAMKDPADLRFEDIQVGDRASFRHQITQDDIERFAALSGDRNPLHLDATYAQTTEFTRPIVHGMLLASLLSRLVGMYLPGRRALYLSQSLDFASPVYSGEQVEVIGWVQQKNEAMRVLVLRTEIYAPPQRLAVRGKAHVKVLP